MPRLTRATLRNAILEDMDEAAQIPLPLIPRAERTPLGEIALNREEESRILLEVDLFKPAKKANKKKPAKAERKRDDMNKENIPEVVEDDSQSTASSAVEEACEDLMKQEKNATDGQIRMTDQRPRTPPSKAVRVARKKLSPSPKRAQTPRFDPTVHKAPEQKQVTEARGQGDSFLDSIQSRSPVKIPNMMEPSEVRMSIVDPKIDSDPFLKRKITPSSSPRIEDSVEEIDGLEDAIENVGKLIPTVIDEPKSPAESVEQGIQKTCPSKLAKAAKKPASSTARKTIKSKKSMTSSTKKVPSKGAPSTSPAAKPKFYPATKSTAARLFTTKTHTPPKLTNPLTKSSLTPSSSSTKLQSLAHRPKPRVSSISKEPFVPAKSSKPPTTSTFTLPGDAASAKLKAQREERLKRESQGAEKEKEHVDSNRRPSFKAKPVRISSVSAPVVRHTTASRARLSSFNKVTSDANEDIKSTTTVPSTTIKAPKPFKAQSKTSSIVPTNISKPKPRTSISTIKPTTKPLSPILHSKRAPQAPSHRPSLTSKSATAAPLGALTRKEKEEAAKKARAEAAERGRKASREWAERMKAKKVGVSGSGAGKVEEKKKEGMADTGSVMEENRAASAAAIIV